jgi:iron complex transport system ATP-binding protein
MAGMEVRVSGVSKRYGEMMAVDNLSFEVHPGQVVALVGPNGSGKSTLIKIMATIHNPTSGSITFDGNDIFTADPADLATRVGYVPQHFTYTLYNTVFETILLGRRRHIKWSVSAEELTRVQNALDTLEIGHLAAKNMDQLSGGERQKVFVARALAQDPALYLFDEPTSALDIRHQIDVMEIMREVTRSRNAAMIIAVHDLNLAYRYADVVVMLDHGTRIGYGRPDDVLTAGTIDRVYGVTACMVENEFGRFLLPVRKSDVPALHETGTTRE